MANNFYGSVEKVIISNFSGRLELLPSMDETGVTTDAAGTEAEIKEISFRPEGDLLTIVDEALPEPNAYFELSGKVLKVYIPKDIEVEIREASGITYFGTLKSHCKTLFASIRNGTLTAESVSNMTLEISEGDVTINDLAEKNTIIAKKNSVVGIKRAVGEIEISADSSYVKIKESELPNMKISASNGSTVKIQCGTEIGEVKKEVSPDSKVIIKQKK